ncbi:prolipoprotein diacylglyceryl transferase [bacterium BMS3Abin03]|nr:prolipoprotein diacylglyceryl transferase [bacterium BMS3Abin03]
MEEQKKSWADGKLFLLYLILSSISRFLVEFIRLNPKILLGLTEAQLISIVLGSVGLFGLYKLSSNKNNVIVKSPSQK